MQLEHFPLQVVDGDTVDLSSEDVRRAASVVEPQSGSVGSALVSGFYYDPVALVSEAAHVAERRLSRRAAIFALQQLSIPIRDVDPPPLTPEAGSALPMRYSSRLLNELRSVPGEWVAVRGEEVVHAARSLRLLLEQLDDTDVSVFKAPTQDESAT